MDPYPGYWVKSERGIIDRMLDRVDHDRESFKHPSWLMDAGCGWGRLLPHFHGFFDRILAVEPDPERLDGARKTAGREGFIEKTEFVQAQLQYIDWPEGSIDVGVCSHIIQHVGLETSSQIVSMLGKLIRNDGLLLLTTSHSTALRELYAVGRIEDDAAKFELVNRETFERVAAGGLEGLPVRFYTLGGLEALLDRAGFSVLDMQVFQLMASSRLLSTMDRTVGRDRFANSLTFLKDRMGSNVYVAARKRSQ
jgi:hypothetical protein